MPSSATRLRPTLPLLLSFPTRRSSDLRSTSVTCLAMCRPTSGCASSVCRGTPCTTSAPTTRTAPPSCSAPRRPASRPNSSSRAYARKDRKSTRLNSSHLVISYAVFCYSITPHPPTTPLFPYTPLFRSPIHLGHMLGYVQADIWVRFQRMQGHTVHYVCADDTHGTAIMLSAEKAGITPEQFIAGIRQERSEEHTSELKSPCNLVCRLLLLDYAPPSHYSSLSLHAALPISDPPRSHAWLCAGRHLGALPAYAGAHRALRLRRRHARHRHHAQRREGRHHARTVHRGHTPGKIGRAHV